MLNLTDNLNPDDPPDADDQLYELARTKAKERYQRPPAVDLQLLEGWSHPLDNWYFADKVWPDHRHFLAPTPPHGLAFANTPEALASHPPVPSQQRARPQRRTALLLPLPSR